MAPTAGLTLRKLADKSGDTLEDGSWPLVGLRIENDTLPAQTRLSTALVDAGIREGWIRVEGQRMVLRPAGPANDPWGPTAQGDKGHQFRHCDVIVFQTVDGDVRYRVVHQPDKYVDERDHQAVAHGKYAVKPLVDPGGNDDVPVTDAHYAGGQTAVHWFYDVELEG